MPPCRVEILGVPVDCVDPGSALEFAAAQLRAPTAACTVIAVNPEKMMRAQRDPRLLATLLRAGLLIPDGIGVVVAARLFGLPRMRRVPGCELMPQLCALAERSGASVFLFGATRAVNDAAAAALRARYPRLVIAGSQDGYATEAEMPGVIAAINASGAHILFVALGSPRQELWMARYLPQLPLVRLCQGVGGTFDVLAGTVRRAPPLFIRLNLEWLYRLLAQPGRLLRQRALPRFAWQVLSARLLDVANPRGPAE